MTCSRGARNRSPGSMRGQWSRRRRAASTGRATRRRSGSTRARARSARRASGCNAWNRSDRTTRRATSRMPRRPRTPDEQTGSQPGLLLTRLRLASDRPRRDLRVARRVVRQQQQQRARSAPPLSHGEKCAACHPPLLVRLAPPLRPVRLPLRGHRGLRDGAEQAR